MPIHALYHLLPIFTVYLLFIVVWLSRYVQIPVAVCLFRRTCRHSLRTRVDLSTPSTSTPLSLPPISRSGTPHSGPWTPATRGALSTSAELSRSQQIPSVFKSVFKWWMSLHVTTCHYQCAVCVCLERRLRRVLSCS